MDFTDWQKHWNSDFCIDGTILTRDRASDLMALLQSCLPSFKYAGTLQFLGIQGHV